mgnify:CR=1 FL=1
MVTRSKIKKIIFAAHDAGGFDALFPVIQKLRGRRAFKILNLLGGPAALIAKRNKIAYTDAHGSSDEEILEIVRSFSPDIVVTGTSSGVYIDKRTFRAARRLGIPTAAILDSWVNYSPQFILNNKQKVALSDLPDKILVMDDISRREMIQEGFPAKKIVITGNPHFASFKRFKKVPAGGPERAVFIDQHLSELMKSGIHEDLGYAEIEVFRDLVNALEDLNWRGELVIKFHPGSKDLTRFDRTIAGSGLKIVKAKENAELRDILDRSRFVFGMASMALFESALGGKTVLSYQPKLRRKTDHLISNRIGLSYAVYERSELKPMLKKVLFSDSPRAKYLRQIKKYTNKQAASKVIRVLLSMIKAV